MAMATLNHSSSALTVSTDVPLMQNTALVLEFRCLYTSDLRRKQKRWQDGRLKFHTFNKRVMVYDERSNSVGDTHWWKDYNFDEGEELELERGGILVEVGECIGKRDQNLTELVEKRVKDREERVAAKNTAMTMGPQGAFSQPQTPGGSALLRPKSLNAVLGIPTGHYGKAVVPTVSPFEQRQQASRDKSENERPTKRRKQDDIHASKTGYAQNLLGTKLNLASSRPPSTATITYEPVRPSIQRTSAVSIDLTLDKDDYGPITIGVGRHTKAQRRKAYDSSPARNRYANNFTATSLSSNKNGILTSRRSAGGLDFNTKGLRQTERANSSPSVGPDSARKDDFSEELPAKRIQQQRKPGKQKGNPQQLDPQLPCRSSSPPVTRWPTSVAKSTSSVKDIVKPDPLGTRLTADQPVSTLRIKSRAPRKMMMLMERPIPCPPATTESSNDTLVVNKQLNSKPAQDPVLSRSTLLSDASWVQEDWRLRQHLSDDRVDTNMDIPSSSSADSGIDHRMLDVPKAVPKSSIRSTDATSEFISLLDAQEPHQAHPISGGKELEQSTHPSIDAASIIAPSPSDPVAVIPLDPVAGEVISNECGQEILRRNPPLATICETEEALDAEDFHQAAVVSSKPKRPEVYCERTSPQSSPFIANSNLPTAGQSSLNPHPAIHEDVDIAPVMSKSIAMVSPTTRSKTPSLSPPFSGSIMSATDRFRSIIKYPPSSSKQTPLQNPPALEQPDVPPGGIVEAQGDPILGECAIKAPPTPYPLIAAALSIDAQRDEVVKSRGRMVNTADLTSAMVPNATTGQLKAKLANPATRGLSVQMTANKTVNAIVNAPNPLPSMPPPQRTLKRPGTIPAQGESLPNRTKEPVIEVTPGGPWSRESFDLFGPWRPPRRATCSSTVNG